MPGAGGGARPCGSRARERRGVAASPHSARPGPPRSGRDRLPHRRDGCRPAGSPTRRNVPWGARRATRPGGRSPGKRRGRRRPDPGERRAWVSPAPGEGRRARPRSRMEIERAMTDRPLEHSRFFEDPGPRIVLLYHALRGWSHPVLCRGAHANARPAPPFPPMFLTTRLPRASGGRPGDDRTRLAGPAGRGPGGERSRFRDRSPGSRPGRSG